MTDDRVWESVILQLRKGSKSTNILSTPASALLKNRVAKQPEFRNSMTAHKQPLLRGSCQRNLIFWCKHPSCFNLLASRGHRTIAHIVFDLNPRNPTSIAVRSVFGLFCLGGQFLDASRTEVEDGVLLYRPAREYTLPCNMLWNSLRDTTVTNQE